MIRRIAVAGALVPLLFAVGGLTAWTTGVLQLASLNTTYIPMAPSTALAFMLVGSALITLACDPQAIARELVRGAALLVFVLATIKVIEFLSGATIINVEAALIARPGQFHGVPLARMSPVTAVALALCGIALVCLTGIAAARVRHAGGLLGSIVGLIGVTVVLGYSYGAPLLYGGTVIPMALTTGIAFLGTGIALVAIAGPAALPLRPFCEGAVRAEVAETLNQELLERSAYALGAAGAGIWDIDLTTRIMRCSALMGPMFGLPYQPFETTVDAFRARMHADDRPSLDAALAHSIHADAPYGAQFRAVCEDDRVRWVNIKGRITRDADGTPITMLGIAIDVTERKELEQQLEHAQRLESLGQLAGSIAHDFNNVLAAILGFSELLLQELTPGDRAASDVAEIHRAGESGRTLTRQLLAFSRQQPLQPTRVDLNSVVTTSAGIVQQLLSKRVQLDLALAPILGEVWADAGQMQQILVNLAVNGRDAIDGDGRLRIKTYCDAGSANASSGGRHPASQVVLEVTDTGIGMSRETMARIFEPFFTTKAIGKGTGLGLSTVYGIVQQSSGAITVSSTVGGGTTFRIAFPRLAEAAALAVASHAT
jgi:PAS domain S-box-containing protein